MGSLNALPLTIPNIKYNLEVIMSLYHNFIGVDIGKFSFVASIYPSKTTKEYTNDSAGITSFIHDFKTRLPSSLVVLETTGGYEMKLLKVLCNKNYRVHVYRDSNTSQ